MARGERARPFLADEHAELLRRKGERHERAYLERLRAEGRQIVEITLGEPWDFDAAARRTAESATKRSEKGVVQRREQDARAADLAPDTTIDATGLGPEVVTGIELLVVDGQLTVKEVQFFNAGMAVGWILGSRREPHHHADAVLLRIGREQLAGDARRHFFPFRFHPLLLR